MQLSVLTRGTGFRLHSPSLKIILMLDIIGKMLSRVTVSTRGTAILKNITILKDQN
ncbi:hypothetical protein ES705_16999 [subsurface metagenome]